MASVLLSCIFRHCEQWNAQVHWHSEQTSDESDWKEWQDLHQLYRAVCFVHVCVLRENGWSWVNRESAAARHGAENSGQLSHPERYFTEGVRGPAQHRVPQSKRAGQPAPDRHRQFQGEEGCRGAKLSTRRQVRLLMKPCKNSQRPQRMKVPALFTCRCDNRQTERRELLV